MLIGQRQSVQDSTGNTGVAEVIYYRGRNKFSNQQSY